MEPTHGMQRNCETIKFHYEHFSAQVNKHANVDRLSNKNVLSNFLKWFLLREESFNLAGRSFQIVGPEALNDKCVPIIIADSFILVNYILNIIIIM